MGVPTMPEEAMSNESSWTSAVLASCQLDESGSSTLQEIAIFVGAKGTYLTGDYDLAKPVWCPQESILWNAIPRLIQAHAEFCHGGRNTPAPSRAAS